MHDYFWQRRGGATEYNATSHISPCLWMNKCINEAMNCSCKRRLASPHHVTSWTSAVGTSCRPGVAPSSSRSTTPSMWRHSEFQTTVGVSSLTHGRRGKRVRRTGNEDMKHQQIKTGTLQMIDEHPTAPLKCSTKEGPTHKNKSVEDEDNYARICDTIRFGLRPGIEYNS